MDEIMIGIDFMKIGWVVAVPLIVICIITYAFNCKISEFTFALLKAFFYGMLEFYMWRYVCKKGMTEIGVVTAFTSIFCGLECGDNIVKVICMIIEYFKKWAKVIKNK